MKTMQKKIMSFILALVLIVSIMPVGIIPSSAAGGVKVKLDSFIEEYPNGSRWTGSFIGGIQCYGFAQMAVYEIFGKTSSGAYRDWTYAGTGRVGMEIIGSITSFSSANVKSLLSKAKCGDILQFNTPKQHTMIIYAVESDGVRVYDCNWDNNCGISLRKSSFGAWSGRNSTKLSLLRADNYTSINGSAISHKVDTKYGKNFTAYPKAKITASSIFDANHNQISSTAWIGVSDKCTIQEVYTDGCCKVTYPLDSGGTKTVYSKISLFKTHTHNYSGEKVYESEHPHAISQRCVDYDTCGGFIWTGEYKKLNTCEKCWNIDWECSVSGVNIKTGESKKVTISINGNTACYPDGSKFRCEYDTALIDMVQNGQEFTFTGKRKGACEFTIIAYSGASGETISRFRIPITVDTKTYTISYNANGGTGAPSSQTKIYGESLVLSSKQPTRSGYTFLGWSTSSTAKNATYLPGRGYTANADATLYGVWKANTYTVKYNSNGGTGTMANSSHTYDTAKALTKNGFTKTGYTFAGWSTSSASTATQYIDGATVKNLTSTNNATVNLYARWKPNEYSIYYNSNGGTGLMETSSHYYDAVKSLSANKFTRDGYTFLGWSLNPYATSATYEDKQLVNNLSAINGDNVTLYAVWQKNPSTVSSVSVQSLPLKTVYTVGETFMSNGLSVKVNMSDGASKTITSGFTVSSPDMSTAGIKTVTVTYEGKTATFSITVKKAVSQTSAQYKISGATATAGSIVEVYISIENNPGIITLRNKVEYDTSVLELVKAEDMKLLAGYTTPSPTLDSPYTLRWADSLATQNNSENGNIAKLTFKIKDDIPTGDYKISILHIESRKANGEQVEFADCSATITVVDYISGDADGNGEVNDWDSVLLDRYLAGWTVVINEYAADVDGNGEVNDWDAVLLSRKLAGWS